MTRQSENTAHSLDVSHRTVEEEYRCTKAETEVIEQ